MPRRISRPTIATGQLPTAPSRGWSAQRASTAAKWTSAGGIAVMGHLHPIARPGGSTAGALYPITRSHHSAGPPLVLARTVEARLTLHLPPLMPRRAPPQPPKHCSRLGVLYLSQRPVLARSWSTKSAGAMSVRTQPRAGRSLRAQPTFGSSQSPCLAPAWHSQGSRASFTVNKTAKA